MRNKIKICVKSRDKYLKSYAFIVREFHSSILSTTVFVYLNSRICDFLNQLLINYLTSVRSSELYKDEKTGI